MFLCSRIPAVTEEKLTRALPSRFVLAVTVGGVIGLGILRGPGEIAERETALYAVVMMAVSWPVYRYLVRK